MEENTQHFLAIMLYYFKKVKNATDTHKKVCAVYAVYGEGAVTDWTGQKWLVKFCAGDFVLDDAPRSGRPVEADSDQIETLIENHQCYTMWEMANVLKISKSIKLMVKIKKCVFYFTEKIIQSFWPTQCWQ